jgi:predicted DNA-binding protein with PD1-like motif
MNGFGGHVRELQVGGTCELFIHLKQGSNRWTRREDTSIGLKLLDIDYEGAS